MKFLLIILVLLFSLSRPLKHVRILISSADLKKGGIVIDSVKSIDYCWNGDLTINAINRDYFYHANSIWGIESNYEILRFKPNSGQIPLEATEPIVIYHSYGSKHDHYYFSKTLNSQIFSLSKSRLKKVYKKDTLLHKNLDGEFKWYEPISLKDNKTRNLRLIDVFQKSIKY